jgi:hypothetical protein
MFGVSLVEPFNLLDVSRRVPIAVTVTVTVTSTSILRVQLLHLRHNFICTIEDPTSGRSAGRAFRRLCKSLDCARRAEVMTASSDDRVCKGMAAN